MDGDLLLLIRQSSHQIHHQPDTMCIKADLIRISTNDVIMDQQFASMTLGIYSAIDRSANLYYVSQWACSLGKGLEVCRSASAGDRFSILYVCLVRQCSINWPPYRFFL